MLMVKILIKITYMMRILILKIKQIYRDLIIKLI
jgi:hypothetical protein